MGVKHHFFNYALVALVLGVVAWAGIGNFLKINITKNKPPLPEVVFYNDSLEKKTLADFKGKVLLVNLWATWCTPCVVEMPSLQALQEKLGEEDFKVIAISLDRKDMATVTAFLKEKNVKLPAYWDKDRQIPLKWRYDGIPVSFLIDRDGSVIASYNGGMKWDGGGAFDDVSRAVRR